MQLITVAQNLPTVLFFFCAILTVQIHNISTPQNEVYIKVTASQILHHICVVLMVAFSFP